jgi:hypothetical protein
VPDGYGGWRWIGATPPIGPRPSGDSRNADRYVLPEPVAKTPQESLDRWFKQNEAQWAAQKAARDFAEGVAARDAEWARWGGGAASNDQYDLYILQRDRRGMYVGFSAMAMVPGAQAFAIIPFVMDVTEGNLVQATISMALLGAGPAWRLARGAPTPSVGAVASNGIRGGQNTCQLVARPPRLLQDINVNPTAPPVRALNRPIGQSPTQNAAMQADIAAARAQGATDIRVNQQQVNAAGQRVGTNRPDLQYTDANGRRVYVEYDTTSSTRGPGHQTRILANDPNSTVILRTVD